MTEEFALLFHSLPSDVFQRVTEEARAAWSGGGFQYAEEPVRDVCGNIIYWRVTAAVNENPFVQEAHLLTVARKRVMERLTADCFAAQLAAVIVESKRRIAEEQQDLPEDAARVLRENMGDLYHE